MNKNILIADVAEKTGISKKQSKEIVEAVFESISNALEAGDNVQIVGFGNFKVKERAERKGVSLQSKDKRVFPPCKVVSFKIGKTLRDSLNGENE
mgnify:FL=1